MSNLVVDTLTNQDVQLCKAWVNFNGTGTVAIRASYNVSSITDNGTGDYTVNYTTNMADVNYMCSGLTGRDPGGNGVLIDARPSSTTPLSSFRFYTLGTSFSPVDSGYITIQIQGN